MGTRWAKLGNSADGCSPTRWVGLSGVTSSGCCASSSRSSRSRRSYCLVGDLGRGQGVVEVLVPADLVALSWARRFSASSLVTGGGPRRCPGHSCSRAARSPRAARPLRSAATRTPPPAPRPRAPARAGHARRRRPSPAAVGRSPWPAARLPRPGAAEPRPSTARAVQPPALRASQGPGLGVVAPGRGAASTGGPGSRRSGGGRGGGAGTPPPGRGGRGRAAARTNGRLVANGRRRISGRGPG